MYRLIIIDDEHTVRTGIKQLIDWEKYEMEICAEAEDGAEGLIKIMQYEPDLVLLDIMMPEMSGIEMIQKAREQGFRGKCILLTGYSDFEFAKQAIRLGVEDYLLKPIDDEELDKRIEIIYEEFKQEEKLEKSKEEVEQKAKNEVLRSLLLCMEDEGRLQNYLTKYDFDRNCHSFCVAVVDTGTENGAVEYSRCMEEKQKAFVFGLENVEIIRLENKLILVGKNIGMEKFCQCLTENNQKIRTRYKRGFFIAVGLEVVQWEDLHFSYESAKLLLDYKFLFECEEVVDWNSCWQSGEEITCDDMEDELLDVIEAGDENSIRNLFAQQMRYCRSELKREDIIKLYFMEKVLKIYNRLMEEYPQQSKSMPAMTKITEAIRDAESLRELTDILTENCLEISRSIVLDSEHVIGRILSYMDKHYYEGLTMQKIARVFGYNNAYLGKLFKDTTGECFNNMLDRIRIEKCKSLILEGNLKIYQIAEKVGYKDINYFYVKFKRNVGKSPKDFRADGR